MKERTYICCDLKSFYASVECVERGLDPMTTNLVVADLRRTEKTICLAVTPSLKSYGISGRARLFEVVQKVAEVNARRRQAAPGRQLTGSSWNDPEVQRDSSLALDYIVAPPRMAHYIDWSTKIYGVYLKYLAPEDIFPYSIDEVFMDVTNYLDTYIVGEEKETGVSGYKVSADDRDKLQLIKKYAEQGKFDILLVFMFDRLGRKSDETPFVVEWFAKKGVRVWSVKEGEQRFESHTDRLTNYIRFWQADGESQKTSMRTKTALGQMVEEGRFRGGNAPYGYRLEKSGILNKRKHEVYMLVIDEDEARVVRMMFDLCVSSGYGRWRLANFLNDHGIKNRKGQNWHDASVGGILHNPLYKGILRSGETYAGPFDELQIIAPDHFDLAQKLMLERTNERKEHRTVPLNTTGQSLLSGNIFCGHCGGRLVLTTNGKTVRRADGTAVYKKRIRYVCYNKTRRRQECTGQTGYTMHIVDGIVTEVLHQVFNKMQGASGDMIVGSAVQKQMAMIRSELQRARAENTKANKEYESLKAEVLKAIQGKSALPQDVLSEMLEDARQKVLSSSERITELTAELNDGNSKIEEMKAEFNQIVSWSKIFDDSPMEVKKMICGYIIKKVSVCKDYDIKIEFNINVEQFLNGIDGVSECDTSELSIAQ